ncbi:hypothetical protein OAM67_00330 [bacterium]|nr:hypothetical protein [bacterium]
MPNDVIDLKSNPFDALSPTGAKIVKIVQAGSRKTLLTIDVQGKTLLDVKKLVAEACPARPTTPNRPLLRRDRGFGRRSSPIDQKKNSTLHVHLVCDKTPVRAIVDLHNAAICKKPVVLIPVAFKDSLKEYGLPDVDAFCRFLYTNRSKVLVSGSWALKQLGQHEWSANDLDIFTGDVGIADCVKEMLAGAEIVPTGDPANVKNPTYFTTRAQNSRNGLLNVVTFRYPNCAHNIQLIVFKLDDPLQDALAQTFDFDFCKVVFDGKYFSLLQRRSENVEEHGAVLKSARYDRSGLESYMYYRVVLRAFKYVERGFRIFLPDTIRVQEKNSDVLSLAQRSLIKTLYPFMKQTTHYFVYCHTKKAMNEDIVGHHVAKSWWSLFDFLLGETKVWSEAVQAKGFDAAKKCICDYAEIESSSDSDDDEEVDSIALHDEADGW